jgi:NIPSNAP
VAAGVPGDKYPTDAGSDGQTGPMRTPCAVYELRQYTLHPGRRDELIELFDTHLVEPQEDAGMHVVGQFRDVDRPDRFVWLRGFPDMAARLDGLTRFYLESEAWARHRGAANATMIDSDDVLLLRPAPDTPDLCSDLVRRPEAGGAAAPGRVYAIDIHHPGDGADDAGLGTSGGEVVAVLRSEHAPNNFPRLPIREDADVLVVVSRFDSREQPRAGAAGGGAQRLVLEPTSRSALR